MHNDVERILYSESDIEAICARLGSQISKDYANKKLLLVSVLKGSIVFMADLMRHITIPCVIDFMSVSSYGSKTKSSGIVKINLDLNVNLEGYDLLIVEDILDSGKTLYSLRSMLSLRKPNSIKICTLLDKPDRREANVNADYIGAKVPDKFIIGYGLDFDERYRNLPYIGILKESLIPKNE